MEKITLQHLEYLKKIFLLLDKYNYLTNMLNKYQVDPITVITELHTITDEDYLDIQDKFINVYDGLSGVNTKDKAIVIGMKTIITLLLGYKDSIISTLDVLLKEDQLAVVKTNLTLFTDILDAEVLANNKQQLLTDLAIKEYATHVMDKILTKVVITTEVSNNIWLNNLLLTANSISDYKETLSSFITTLIKDNDLTNLYIKDIVKYKESDNVIIKELPTVVLKEQDGDLSGDINTYVNIKNTDDVNIITTVVALYDVLSTLASSINNNVTNISSWDLSTVKEAFTNYHDINVKYSEGTLTTKEHSKLSLEYFNLTSNKKSELTEYYNKRIDTLVSINDHVNFSYLLATLVNYMVIESTIKNKE